VDLDAVTKNRVHGLIKGHKVTLDKLVVVKGDMHNGHDGTMQSQEGVGVSGQGKRGSCAGVEEGRVLCRGGRPRGQSRGCYWRWIGAITR
jgi:hypothetical protein